MKEIKMKAFSWTETIKVNLLLLKLVGLWPAGDESYKLNFYSLYALITTVLIMGGHNLFQLINIYFIYSDIETLISMIFITSTNLLAYVKVYFFVQNLKVIKQLMVCLRTQQFQPKSIEQRQFSENSLKIWFKFYTCYCSLVFVNILLWSVSPLLSNKIKDKELPFPAWYPFDTAKPGIYNIMYIYQIICLWCMTIANLQIDTFTSALIMLTWSQCDILSDDLKNLCFNFGEKLISCVKHHKEILRFAQNVNDSVTFFILGQFATSTVVLAMTMYQLASVNSLNSETFSHLAYITGLTSQIFQYCWFGNQLMFKSSQISYGIYQSTWFEQSTEIKNDLLILQLKSQKPIQITAIGLFSLSLDTFMKIMRSAWSYFTMLRNVNGS